MSDRQVIAKDQHGKPAGWTYPGSDDIGCTGDAATLARLIAQCHARIAELEAERDAAREREAAMMTDSLLKAGEIKRLKAIVAKLPKTADGVPVVPGMGVHCTETCYTSGEGKITPLYVHEINKDVVVSRFNGTRTDVAGYKHCYSTREAAEVAKDR